MRKQQLKMPAQNKSRICESAVNEASMLQTVGFSGNTLDHS